MILLQLHIIKLAEYRPFAAKLIDITTFGCYYLITDGKLSQMFVATRYATETRSSSNVCRNSICDSSRGRVQMCGTPFGRMEFLY